MKMNNTNSYITSKKYELNEYTVSTDTILTKIQLSLKDWYKTYIQWDEYRWCNGIQQ